MRRHSVYARRCIRACAFVNSISDLFNSALFLQDETSALLQESYQCCAFCLLFSYLWSITYSQNIKFCLSNNFCFLHLKKSEENCPQLSFDCSIAYQCCECQNVRRDTPYTHLKMYSGQKGELGGDGTTLATRSLCNEWQDQMPINL
jgi:hypothetical protein